MNDRIPIIPNSYCKLHDGCNTSLLPPAPENRCVGSWFEGDSMKVFQLEVTYGGGYSSFQEVERVKGGDFIHCGYDFFSSGRGSTWGE